MVDHGSRLPNDNAGYGPICEKLLLCLAVVGLLGLLHCSTVLTPSITTSHCCFRAPYKFALTLHSSLCHNIHTRQQTTSALTSNDDATNLPLWTASASISSKKITAGAAARALRNNSRTAFSDSPTHLDSSSGPWQMNYYTQWYCKCNWANVKHRSWLFYHQNIQIGMDFSPPVTGYKCENRRL